MTPLILGLALITATAAAVRSTWSPCGLSMLSTITPLAERGRGYRYRSTALWFVVGATAGGATLGLGAASFAVLVAELRWSSILLALIAAVAAAIAAASDLRLFGVHLPEHQRQVNEVWLSRYRSWVYGAGFGWQIGTGWATVIMTAAVYLLVVLAALTANSWLALGVCTYFGFLRGLAIFLGSRITTTDQLVSFHRRFDALTAPVRRVVICIQVGVAVTAAVAVGGLWLLGVIAVLVAGLGVRGLRFNSASQSTAPVDPILASEPSPAPR